MGGGERTEEEIVEEGKRSGSRVQMWRGVRASCHLRVLAHVQMRRRLSVEVPVCGAIEGAPATKTQPDGRLCSGYRATSVVRGLTNLI
jgi:hypothetical protein